MSNEVFIKVVLDKRREKRNGKYPLKLRVYTGQPRIQKLYTLDLEYTNDEFVSIMQSKAGDALNAHRLNLQLTEWMAKKIAKELNPFDFDRFESKFFQNTHIAPDIIAYYSDSVIEMDAEQRLNSASNYRNSLQSILDYIQYSTGTKPNKIPFALITEDWLQEYEKYCLNVKSFSPATVGIYLRPLRAIFNKALDKKDIEAEQYPFGRRKYRIPSAEKNIRWASKADYLRTLAAHPQNSDQERARDFLILSILCNDLNPSDIAWLRFENLAGNILVISQTTEEGKRTGFSKSMVCVVPDEVKSIIAKHGNVELNPQSFLFPILKENMTPSQQHHKIEQFTKYLTFHIKALASMPLGFGQKFRPQ